MPFLEGLLFGAGICGTVGPQSLFVLRQGIRGNGALAVAFICSGADVLIIAGAVIGADALAAVSPSAMSIATWAAAIFALAYGYFALAVATRATLQPTLELRDIPTGAYAWSLSGAFALSFLNPQVYIEMLFLVGGFSLQFDPSDRSLFGLGVALVSPLWFFGLAFGGRRCARFSVRPMPIVMLDAGSGVLMLGLAAVMIVRELI